MSSVTAIGTNHAKILTGLQDVKLHNRLAESKAKKWTHILQVLQDVAEMTVNFERSRGHSLPSFEVNYTSAYNNCNSNNSQHYRSSKLPTKETQQCNLRLENLKCWHCQDDHLKKNCPTVPNESKSLHSKPQINKEKQCKLIRSFHKRLQNKKENVNEITTASEDESSDDQLNQFFSEFKKLICEDADEMSI